MGGAPLVDLLGQVGPGQVRGAFIEGDAWDAAGLVDGPAGPADGRVRVVAQSWTSPPSLDLVIDATVERLARLALGAFGNWASGADDAWRRAAERTCRLGRPPRLRQVPPSRQVQRLTRVLSAEPIGFILACGDRSPGPTRLYGMVRAAQWLAANAAGPVVLVLPEDLIHHIELEAIVDWAVVLDRHPDVPAEVRDPRADVAVWPVRGAPHPFSDSEQVIADRLERDERLAPLFEPNAVVRTARGSDHRVDLLWREGKVVVEIDGWSTHRDRASFHNDRLRDYELLISGYAVLRLTHDAVLDDVEKAIDMIRDVVALRSADDSSLAGVPERAARR